MDFAHLSRKDKKCDLSGATQIHIKKEISKGRFLCFLCHYKETKKEQNENLSQEKEAIKLNVMTMSTIEN
jgi:hypothetical protein